MKRRDSRLSKGLNLKGRRMGQGSEPGGDPGDAGRTRPHGKLAVYAGDAPILQAEIPGFQAGGQNLRQHRSLVHPPAEGLRTP
jgi:hypothetical protein